jgi:hypothetical protein
MALCNIPFGLLLLAHVSHCTDRIISGRLNGSDSEVTSQIKMALLVYLACMTIAKASQLTQRQVFFYSVLASLMLWNILLNTYNLRASLEELTRYSVPALLLLYGYFYRDRLDHLVSACFVVTFLNNIVQCLMYSAWISNREFVPMEVLYGTLPRASGMAGLVGFSAMNFACAVISHFCLPPKRRLCYTVFFLTFALLAFAFKSLPAVALFTVAIIGRRGALIVPLILLTGTVGIITIAQWRTGVVTSALLDRYESYGIDVTSARRDSYRVMWESLAGGNLLGEGLGYFGGPASTKYDSPAYLEYNSLSPVYYGRTTTDTYYPHLFVELGLVGGAWFLGMLLLPWLTFRNRETLVPYAILCLYLFADSLASFLMHSLDAMPITALLFGIAGMSTVRSSEGGRGLLGGPNASRRSIPHMVETARAARSPRVA